MKLLNHQTDSWDHTEYVELETEALTIFADLDPFQEQELQFGIIASYDSITPHAVQLVADALHLSSAAKLKQHFALSLLQEMLSRFYETTKVRTGETVA